MSSLPKIQKLHLKNFKSFRKAEIPFSNGFTSIVGSNGSGKSNILDALLFVMGSTSLKSIRASKLTDLINSSTSENYAKVELCLKKGKDKYEISRLIDKTGKSVFRINGNRKQLNEVSSLLSGLGFSNENHNIVVQGDITKIINLSPLQRREIIDDTAGLKEFDEKKAEAEKELDKVAQKIKDVRIVLNERNSFLLDVEKEKQLAEKYNSLKEKKNSIKATLIYKELQENISFLDNANKNLNSLSIKKQEIEDKLSSAEEELKESKKELVSINQNIIESNKKIYSEVGSDLESKKSDLRVLLESIDFNSKVFEKNQKKLFGIEKEISEIDNKKTFSFSEKEKLENKLAPIMEQIEVLQNQKSELEQSVESKNKEIVLLKKELIDLEDDFKQINSEIFELELESKNIDSKNELTKNSTIKIKREIDSLNSDLKKFDVFEKELESINKNYSDCSKLLLDNKKQLEHINESYHETIAKINELEKSIKELNLSDSVCFVCESPLDDKNKKLLLLKKQNLIKSLNQELSSFSTKKNNTLELISKIESVISRKQFLESELRNKEYILNKLNSLNAELKDLVIISNNDLNHKIDSLSSKQLVKQNEINELEEKIDSLKSNSLFDEFRIVNKKISELNETKFELSNKINSINFDLNKGFDEQLIQLNKEKSSLLSENESVSDSLSNKKSLSDELKKQIQELEIQLNHHKKNQQGLYKTRDVCEHNLSKFEQQIISFNSQIKKIDYDIQKINIEIGKTSVRKTDLEQEFEQFTSTNLLEVDNIKDLKNELPKIENMLEDMGAINQKALEKYDELNEEIKDIEFKMNKLEQERYSVIDLINSIEIKRTNVFLECFNAIKNNFHEMFFSFFEGEGTLNLTNPDSPLESGLLIEAKHKGNSLQSIDSMSGGEKTLTAIAFLFAIQLYRPAPFYVFDEADAALDKVNSAKLANLIKKMADSSQFIAITHNDSLIKFADQIVGVTLNSSKSSVIGLKLKASVNQEIE